MPLAGRPSTPADLGRITDLLKEAHHLDGHVAAFDPDFLRAKYWDAHPFGAEHRSQILEDADVVVAHGCAWPIRLCTASGVTDAFHLIDWAASSSTPGAGMKVLRQCCSGMTAMIAIGGSSMTKGVLPAFGFKPYNLMRFFGRPLRLLQPALSANPTDWKTPARLARNAYRCLSPSRKVPSGWSFSVVEPSEIPESLWPAAAGTTAMSARSPELLAHITALPPSRRSASAVLKDPSGRTVAYFSLVQVRDDVRVADYGPADLDEETSRILSLAAQTLARELCPDAVSVSAATSEAKTAAGFLGSGLHTQREETISVLKLHKSLRPIDRFRLTLLDSDALYL